MRLQRLFSPVKIRTGSHPFYPKHELERMLQCRTGTTKSGGAGRDLKMCTHCTCIHTCTLVGVYRHRHVCACLYVLVSNSGLCACFLKGAWALRSRGWQPGRTQQGSLLSELFAASKGHVMFPGNCLTGFGCCNTRSAFPLCPCFSGNVPSSCFHIDLITQPDELGTSLRLPPAHRAALSPGLPASVAWGVWVGVDTGGRAWGLFLLLMGGLAVEGGGDRQSPGPLSHTVNAQRRTRSRPISKISQLLFPSVLEARFEPGGSSCLDPTASMDLLPAKSCPRSSAREEQCRRPALLLFTDTACSSTSGHDPPPAKRLGHPEGSGNGEHF